MVYHLPKTIFYLFFLFIGLFPPCWAKTGVFEDVERLNSEMKFLEKYAEPFVFVTKEDSDSVSTKQAAIKKTDKKVDADSILQELEEETGAFKPSPPHYTN